MGVLGVFGPGIVQGTSWFPVRNVNGQRHTGHITYNFPDAGQTVYARGFQCLIHVAITGVTYNLEFGIYDRTANSMKYTDTFSVSTTIANQVQQHDFPISTPFVMEVGHDYVCLLRSTETISEENPVGARALADQGTITYYNAYNSTAWAFPDPLPAENFTTTTALWNHRIIYGDEDTPFDFDDDGIFFLGHDVVGRLNEGVLTISGEGPTFDYGSVDSPLYNNGTIKSVVVESGVTALGSNLFRLCAGLFYANLASSVTQINGSCFRSSGLRLINLSNITTLGTYAFAYCGLLTSIKAFNANLTEIPSHCFNGCDLTGTIDLSNVTTLGSYAFRNNDKLTSIMSFNANLTEIPMYCFSGCDLTGTIDLSSVTNIGRDAFYENKNLTTVNLSGVTTIGSYAFSGCDLTGTIDLSSVTTLGTFAFRENDKLTSIMSFNANLTEIPSHCFHGCDLTGTIDLSNVTTLGTFAFYDCYNLTTVDLSSVTSLGTYVFSNCSSLSTVTALNPSLTEIPTACFRNCGFTSLDFSTAPWNNITSLSGIEAFRDNKNLTTINLSSVTSLGGWDFYDCVNLSTVTALNPSLTILPDFCFRNCGFTSLDFSTAPWNNITTLGQDAFSDNKNLTSVNLSSVTSLGVSSFYDCVNLSTVTAFNPVITELPANCFRNCGFTSLDFSTAPWNNITSLGYSAFLDNKNITSANLSGVTTLGNSAFQNNKNLTTIDLSSVTSLGDWAFRDCSSLSTVTALNPSLTEIPFHCFRNCGFTSLDFSAAPWNNITSLVDYAFAENENLTTIDLSSVTLLGAHTFWLCSNLSTVTAFNPIITTIPSNCFRECGFTSLDFSTAPWNNITTLGQDAFHDCDNLTTIDLSSVTTIGTWAFRGCSNLSTVTAFNPAITTIPSNCFRSCGFTSLDFSTAPWNNITSLGDYAFSYNISLASVNLSSVTTIGTYTFFGCRNMSAVDSLNPSLTEIPTACFSGCGFTSLDFSAAPWNNITSLGSSAFFYNLSLASVNLSNITSLGTWVFAENPLLSEVTDFNPIISEIPDACFRECGFTSLDFSTAPWNNITSLGEAAFRSNQNLTSVNLSSVTSLGANTFAYNPILSEVTALNLSLTEIPSDCFRSCNLTTIDSSNVNIIGNHAFRDNKNLTTIDLSSVTTIGTYAFHDCDNLTTIDLSSVTSLGIYAFWRCSNLSTVTAFNLSLTEIPSDCFNGCNLSSVDLSNVVTLENYAFAGNQNLTTIDLSSVTSLGSYTFRGCDSLSTVTAFNPIITEIPDYCFRNCGFTSLDFSTAPWNNITSLGNSAFAENENLTTVDLSSVTSLGDFTFWLCRNLSTVTALNPNLAEIPSSCLRGCGFTSLDFSSAPWNNIISLSDWAFSSNRNLTSVNLSSIVSLGVDAFGTCSNLSEVVALHPEVTIIPNNCFRSCALTSLDSSAAPWNNITYLGNSAFSSNNMTSVNLSSIINIGTYTFSSCSNLSTVAAFNPGLTELPDFCFRRCGFTSLDFSAAPWNNITSLGGSTFRDNKNLTSVNLSSVTSLDAWVFAENPLLSEVTAFNPAITTIPSNCFRSCGFTSLDFSTAPWNNITSLESSAFSYNISLASVNLSSVTSLGIYTFIGCRNMSAVDSLNPSLTEIPTACFRECGFTSLDFSSAPWNNITSLGAEAFRYNRNLTTVDLSSVTSLGANTFAYCLRLKEVTALNPALHSIPNYCFRDCGLIHLDFDREDLSNINSIGDGAFLSNKDLRVVRLGTSINSVGVSAFSGCSELRLLDMYSATVTGIEEGFVMSSDKLKVIILPESVDSIGERAFSGYGNRVVINPYEGNQTIAEGALSSIAGDIKITYAHSSNTNYINAAGAEGFSVVSYDEAMAHMFDGGDGTVANPFQVSDYERLNYVRYGLDKHFIQTADIDCMELGYKYNFEPIMAFEGHYDGQGHKIANLYISSNSKWSVGLFGTTWSSSIKRVGLISPHIECIGNEYLGGLLGSAWGDVTVEECYIENGYLYGNHDIVSMGGIVSYFGVDTCSMKNCYFQGSLEADSGYSLRMGGLISRTFETVYIENCYAVSTFSYTTDDTTPQVGGLLSLLENNGTISNCYWDSTVSGITSGNGTPKTTAEMKTLTTFTPEWDIVNWNVYNATTPNVWYIEGGHDYPMLWHEYHPDSYDMDGTGTEQDPFLVKTYRTLLRVGTGFNGWGLSNHYEQTDDIDCMELGYKDNFDPVGSSSFPFYGSYDGNNHVIDNLNIVRIGKNLGLFSNANGAEIRNIKLKNTKLVSNTGFGYGGAICGQLDNSVVENCSVECSMVDAAESGGAFGRVRSGSVVDSVYVKVNHKIKTSWYGGYGGFAYWVDGRGGYGDIHISNCSVDIMIETTFSSGSAMYPGGFASYVGNGNILMENIYARGKISGRISNAVGFCSISLNELNNLNIKNCYGIVDLLFDTDPVGYPFISYQKKLNDTVTFENCFSAGKGNPNWSGCIDIFGTDEMNLTVSNCYWDTERSGMVQSSEGTPKTTAEMKTLTTFTPEWDIVNWNAYNTTTPNIWYIEEGSSYPLLWYEYHPDYYDLEGAGTEQDPFLVKTYRTLKRVGRGFNGWGMDSHYKQTDNIDCMELGYKDNFDPIMGEDVKSFEGVYDGGNFTISNLYIKTEGFDSYLSAALFWGLDGAKIKNLSMRNAYVDSSNDYATNIDTALLAGQIYDEGAEGTEIINCNFHGKVVANYTACGFIGYAYSGPSAGQSTINKCVIDVEVVAGIAIGVSGWFTRSKVSELVVKGKLSGRYAAHGMFGWVSDYGSLEIEKSAFIGEINDKGFLGSGGKYSGFMDQYSPSKDMREVRDCYINASIDVEQKDAEVGGLFIWVWGSSQTGAFSRCYAVVDIKADHAEDINAFSVNGRNTARPESVYIDIDVNEFFTNDVDGLEGKSTEEMKSPYGVGVYETWDFNSVWREWEGDYPRLRCEMIPVKYINVVSTEGVVEIPIYHTDVAGNLRIAGESEVLGFSLVERGSGLATPVHVSTPDGVKALAREG